jgi:hypothetical protein
MRSSRRALGNESGLGPRVKNGNELVEHELCIDLEGFGDVDEDVPHGAFTVEALPDQAGSGVKDKCCANVDDVNHHFAIHHDPGNSRRHHKDCPMQLMGSANQLGFETCIGLCG